MNFRQIGIFKERPKRPRRCKLGERVLRELTGIDAIGEIPRLLHGGRLLAGDLFKRLHKDDVEGPRVEGRRVGSALNSLNKREEREPVASAGGHAWTITRREVARDAEGDRRGARA